MSPNTALQNMHAADAEEQRQVTVDSDGEFLGGIIISIWIYDTMLEVGVKLRSHWCMIAIPAWTQIKVHLDFSNTW